MAESLLDKICNRMKNYFGEDQRRIQHGLRVREYADQILKSEKGTNREVVILASYLHDIGIPEAVRKYGSTAAKYQQIEGPPIAKKLLKQEEVDEKLIAEICQIIAYHHRPGVVNTNNFKVVYDADQMVNLEDGEIQYGKFITISGRKLARDKGLI